MLLKELNYILAIEKYGTITKAAEHLYISQPALSKYIKTLEETLDTNLLENTGRGIILTDAGKHYAKAARKMMEIYETMSRNLLNSDNMIHGTLRIGTSFTREPAASAGNPRAVPPEVPQRRASALRGKLLQSGNPACERADRFRHRQGPGNEYL